MKIYEIIERSDNIETTLRECDAILAQHGIVLNEAAAAAPSFVGGVRAGAAAPNLAGYAKAGQTAAEKAGVVVGQTATKAAGAVKAKIAKEMTVLNLRGEAVTRFIPKNAIRFVVVLKWLGMLPFFYEYWEEKIAITSLEKKGDLTAEDASAAQRIIIEELVVKITASAGFANLLKWLLRLRYIKWIAGAVGLGVSGMTLGLFGGPAVLGVLATEAAAIWLEQFLQTEEGKKIVANCVMYAIDPTVTWLWNHGPGAWVDALKMHTVSGAGQDKVEKVVTTVGSNKDKAAAVSGSASGTTGASGATGQGAQPATGSEPAGQAFDATGKAYSKWGVSDPFEKSPRTPDVSIFKK